MARCVQYDWDTGQCVNYNYAGVYNLPFHGNTSGQNNPPAGNTPQNTPIPPTANPQNAPVTSFPGGVSSNTSLFSGSGQAPSAFSGNDGIWWLVVAGFALWALAGK